MSGVSLPYNLADGQKAYAAKVMANLYAVADKLNKVSLPGMPECDVESALRQLKLILDDQAAASQKVLSALNFDEESCCLQLVMQDGSLFELNMAPFLNDYQGASGNSVNVVVDSQRRIMAQLANGAVDYQQLSQALQQMLDNMLPAGESGNAAAILFADGESMQQKLDSGQLQGPAGVSAALNSIYAFRVGADGHLYVAVADGEEAPPFSINSNGHLIYSIE